MKTETKIKKKIAELLRKEENFCYEDYGCDGMNDSCCGSCGGMRLSHSNTEETMMNFAGWLVELVEKKIKK